MSLVTRLWLHGFLSNPILSHSSHPFFCITHNTLQPMPGTPINLKFLSLNVNGLRSPTKRRAVFQSLRASEADIFFLQETHSTASEQKVWSSEWGGRILYSHGLSNSRGVAILFKRGCNPKFITTTADPEGRFLVALLKHHSDTIALINIYAPTQSEPRKQLTFMDTLESTLSDLDAHHILMGGISMLT